MRLLSGCSNIVGMELTEGAGAGPNQTLWTGDPFLSEVVAWVSDSVRGQGVRLTGRHTQPHCRPWSSALRFESDRGALWFKVNSPGTRHEGSLVAALAGVEPGLVPQVHAVDAERGWFVMSDAGPVMRSVMDPDELWPHWERLLARYAETQVRLAAHADTFVAAGTPHLTPAELPDLAAALVEELAGLAPERGGLSRQEARALDRGLPAYRQWCEELDASGISSTIQHDDLHSANVCWSSSADDARIVDWGDASVGHPFGTMLVTLNSLAHHAGCTLDDPRVQRARDTYLEPFTGFASRSTLARYVGLARRVGCVTRALSYRAALAGEPTATHRELDFPVRGWLLETLEGGAEPSAKAPPDAGRADP